MRRRTIEYAQFRLGRLRIGGGRLVSGMKQSRVKENGAIEFVQDRRIGKIRGSQNLFHDIINHPRRQFHQSRQVVWQRK